MQVCRQWWRSTASTWTLPPKINFSLLSDPTRIRIILALEAELAVGELAQRVGKSPTAVSQHLAKLRWAKVVQTRQGGDAGLLQPRGRSRARELVHQGVLEPNTSSTCGRSTIVPQTL